jgi:Bromodomain/Homeobox KN domain/PHD-finger
MLDGGQGSQALPEHPLVPASASHPVNAPSAAGDSSKKPKGGTGKRRRSSATGRDASTNKSKSQRSSASTTKAVRFSALWGDSVLDMYTYHRGREGVELRDVDAGDLLCDVEATDTSHGAADAPNLVAQVTVEFSLDDSIPVGHAEARTFRQVVHWDLGDPATAPPMVFAADVAEQFGLSYQQTLQLCESIEGQLHAWMRNHCGHSQPLVLKDAAGSNRDPPASTIYSLYGSGVGSAKGGMPMPSQQTKKKASAKQSMRGLVSRPAGALELAASKADDEDKADAKSKGSAKGSAKRRNGSKAEATPTVEEDYVLEVRRRLRDEASERMKSSRTEESVAEEARSSSDRQCHICQETGGAGTSFACAYDHAFCDAHLPRSFQATGRAEPSPLMLECCPVCVLECACATCSRRLNAVAHLFKTKCAEQGASATDASVESLLEVARDVEAATSAARRSVGKRKKFEFVPPLTARVVQKVPVSEFPREVCNGVDLDPGSEADYRTVYSASGATLSQDITVVSEPPVGEEPPANAVIPQEDGSIDYCIVCGKHGHLLCCDFCPRAFHSSCVEADDVDDKSDSPWQCPSCKKEHLGLPEETFDGSDTLDRIVLGYKPCVGSADVPDEDLTLLKSIAILREMLDYVMKFAFGYVFKHPVDLALVPAYSAVIKNPMDLGTVASRIDDGTYFRTLTDGSLEVALSAIVRDIELVWRNCFTFNFPGSAIYRMAEVQRKATVRAITNSLDASVIEKLKGDIDMAAPLSRIKAGGTPPIAVPSDERPPSSQKARHKISVPTKGSKCRRPIAVLDPDNGRIIKIYSSLQAASAAINLFLGLKYECERDLGGQEIYPKVRVFVKDGAKDPSLLLFGYRWLWLDELRGGKVSFKKTSLSARRAAGEASTVSEVWAVTKNSASDGEVLAKYKSVEEAHTAWLSLLDDGSPVAGPESRTLQAFTSIYLDQDRTIGGAVWKSYNEHQRRVTDSPRRLPPETVEYLKAWMTSSEHVNFPYPTEEEKAEIVAATGIELKQLSNWLVNHRQRYWKAGRTVNVQGTFDMKRTGSPGNGSKASPAVDDGANPSALSLTAGSPTDPNVSPDSLSGIFLPDTADE